MGPVAEGRRQAPPARRIKDPGPLPRKATAFRPMSSHTPLLSPQQHATRARLLTQNQVCTKLGTLQTRPNSGCAPAINVTSRATMAPRTKHTKPNTKPNMKPIRPAPRTRARPPGRPPSVPARPGSEVPERACLAMNLMMSCTAAMAGSSGSGLGGRQALPLHTLPCARHQATQRRPARGRRASAAERSTREAGAAWLCRPLDTGSRGQEPQRGQRRSRCRSRRVPRNSGKHRAAVAHP